MTEKIYSEAPRTCPNILGWWSICIVGGVTYLIFRNALSLAPMYVTWVVLLFRIVQMGENWELIRDTPSYADAADRNAFIRFSLEGSPALHGAAAVLSLLVEFALIKALNHITHVVPDMAQPFVFSVTILTTLVAAYILSILGRALGRDLWGTNHYPDGSQYEREKTYRAAMVELTQRRAAQTEAEERESLRRRQEEAAAMEKEKRLEEEKKRKAEEAAAKRAARAARYEQDKTEGRRKVWQWLNVGYNLDFPDEACDAIADITYGEPEKITGSKVKRALAQIMPEEDAVIYAEKFAAVHSESMKLREEERKLEQAEREAHPLGEPGEAQVDYKLKWWLKRHPEYILISKDCFSRYSANCIRVAAWDYIKEPQEIDHLLVGPCGVIHIETKDYIGRIQVRSTEYWHRDKGMTGSYIPFDSPAFQVRRHDAVLQAIVGEGIPTHAIICLSNQSVELLNAGASEIPVICLRELEAVLDKLDAMAGEPLSAKEIQDTFMRIESAKVRNSKRKAAMEQERVSHE